MVDDWLPGAERVAGAGHPLAFVPGSYADAGRAQGKHAGQRGGRRRQRPPVVTGQPLHQLAVIHLAAVVRVIPVQPRLARIRRIGIGKPKRTARSNRLRLADRAQEPVPGLAAADRAAHRITPSPAGIGFSHHAHNHVMPGHPLSMPRLTATSLSAGYTRDDPARQAIPESQRRR